MCSLNLVFWQSIDLPEWFTKCHSRTGPFTVFGDFGGFQKLKAKKKLAILCRICGLTSRILDVKPHIRHPKAQNIHHIDAYSNLVRIPLGRGPPPLGRGPPLKNR